MSDSQQEGVRITYERRDEKGYDVAEPGLTKDEWKEILTCKDETKDDKRYTNLIKSLNLWYHQPNHEASSGSIAQLYGGSVGGYNSIIESFGKRAFNRYNVYIKPKQDGKVGWVPLAVVKGRYMEPDSYIYMLRDEICQAMEELGLVEDLDKN